MQDTATTTSPLLQRIVTRALKLTCPACQPFGHARHLRASPVPCELFVVVPRADSVGLIAALPHAPPSLAECTGPTVSLIPRACMACYELDDDDRPRLRDDEAYVPVHVSLNAGRGPWHETRRPVPLLQLPQPSAPAGAS
jgi:hypothetical protein